MKEHNWFQPLAKNGRPTKLLQCIKCACWGNTDDKSECKSDEERLAELKKELS